MALCGRIRIPEESSGMFNPFKVKTPEFWSCQYNGVTTKYTRICGARLSLEENLHVLCMEKMENWRCLCLLATEDHQWFTDVKCEHFIMLDFGFG